MPTTPDLEKLKYPIGKYIPPQVITATEISSWITDLSVFPSQVEFVSLLNESDLLKQYRPGGWTVRQVVHHLADSHINAYMRFHLTLTEERPVIRPYYEDRWAHLSDGKDAPVSLSLDILKAVHGRLVFLLKDLDSNHYNRTYYHPENEKEHTLAYLLGNYAWHGKHHLAHLNLALK